jgi:hypothetical protein
VIGCPIVVVSFPSHICHYMVVDLKKLHFFLHKCTQEDLIKTIHSITKFDGYTKSPTSHVSLANKFLDRPFKKIQSFEEIFPLFFLP